ncbi:hypothetical protein PTE30175_00507 [Pandoraea terrae]|uniref:Uncharacterized protein n=1 Tax=Pandoraea terrae TaxID=1537710 RepID=A0A5E4S4X2_9BURK|nr:hypothetical protein [Pandoraea terrae]VVD69772.1 hypothetical protein PTE30175_00507 [Pandoraea terrae]
MLETMLPQFPLSEQEAFSETCLRNGLAPDVFTVTAVEEENTGNGADTPLERSVTVRLGKVVREYDGSQGPQWTVDFEDDVQSHIFG